MGVKEGKIPDKNIYLSSMKVPAFQVDSARLGSEHYWIPSAFDKAPYAIFTLTEPSKLNGFEVRGSVNDLKVFVKTVDRPDEYVPVIDGVC